MKKESIIDRLKLLSKQSMNDIYSSIAKWMINHVNTVNHWKIKDIANQSHCSIGMISKFSKYLKFNGFKELQYQIKDELELTSNFKTLLEPKDLIANFNSSEVSDFYHQIVKESIDFSYNANKAKLALISTAIKKSKTIYLFGSGANLIPIEVFANYLSKMKFNVLWSKDQDSQEYFTANVLKNDLCVLFSYSGLTQHILKIFNNVYKKAKTFCLTANKKSLIYQKATYTFLVKENEEILSYLHNSRQQFIFLIVCICIFLMKTKKL